MGSFIVWTNPCTQHFMCPQCAVADEEGNMSCLLNVSVSLELTTLPIVSKVERFAFLRPVHMVSKNLCGTETNLASTT